MRVLNNTIMPLSQQDLELGMTEGAPLFTPPEGTALLARCKEVFLHVAQALADSGRRVLVPAYTCDTVYQPFVQAGWTHDFYKIDRHMRIDGDHFMEQLTAFRPDVIVAHPYYGQDLNEQEQALLREAKAQGCFIIEDLTQAMDSKRRYDFVDAYCGSLRKWLHIPDGAFYYSKVLPLDTAQLPEYTDFVEPMKDVMYINHLHNETGLQRLADISRRISNAAGEGRSARTPTQLHRMSDFSRRILYGFDFDSYAARRLENARYLWQQLQAHPDCRPVYKDISDITTGPLWFPIYPSDDPQSFRQERFKPARVRAIRMWNPTEPEAHHRISEDVWGLFTQTLQLPVGLDFGQAEMDQIINSIDK